VLDLFPNELPCLGGRSFALPGVCPSPFQSFLFRHKRPPARNQVHVSFRNASKRGKSLGS
jgi:hypothetical protein